MNKIKTDELKIKKKKATQKSISGKKIENTNKFKYTYIYIYVRMIAFSNERVGKTTTLKK